MVTFSCKALMTIWRNLKVQFEPSVRVRIQRRSICRITVRVVNNDKRKWTVTTLKPKGTKSGCNGYVDVTENGQMIFGLKVASKVFTNIYNVELGKSDTLPDIWVETSKEVPMVQRIEDLEKSERQHVMSCIEVQNLP